MKTAMGLEWMGHIIENQDALYNPDKTSVVEHVSHDPFTYPRPWGRYKGIDIVQHKDRFEAGDVVIPCEWPNTAKERCDIVEAICAELELRHG